MSKSAFVNWHRRIGTPDRKLAQQLCRLALRTEEPDGLFVKRHEPLPTRSNSFKRNNAVRKIATGFEHHQTGINRCTVD
jgi:hypothetical protein